jgi:hypothetical protein
VEVKFTIFLPNPINGRQYSPVETVAILGKLQREGKRTNKTILLWIKKGRIPVKLRRVNKLLKDAIDPSYPIAKWWGIVGRKPLATVEELKENLLEDLAAVSQQAATTDNVRKSLVSIHNKKTLERGIQPLGQTLSDRSVRNYKSLFASLKETSVSRSAIQKSNRRYTSEQSLRSVMAYAITVLVSGFIVLPEPCPEYEALELPEGSRISYDIVSKCNGGRPMKPRPPQCIASTDDQTEFAF